MRQAELQQTFGVHLVEQLELGRQLVRLLPLGGELGALLVVVMVGQLLPGVGVPAEGPEPVQVDLVAHGGRQRVHQDPRAQALRRQLLGFPVAAEKRAAKISIWKLCSEKTKKTFVIHVVKPEFIFLSTKIF